MLHFWSPMYKKNPIHIPLATHKVLFKQQVLQIIHTEDFVDQA